MRRPLVLLLTLAALGTPAVARADDPAPERTLGVQGHGEVELAPDVGSFDAEVRRVGATSASAREAANVRLGTIVRRLRGLRIPRADITTTSISLVRERYRTAKTRKLRVRWIASGAFSVRLTDVSRTGPAIDAVSAAGATGVDGPAFSFSPGRSTEGRIAAEQAALADARRRADGAAASQGQRVVGVRSIELDPSSGVTEARPAAGPTAEATTTDSAAPAPILAGRQTFSSAVRVVYLLAPAG